MKKSESEFIHNMSAYKIVRNLVEHSYGDNQEFGVEDFQKIYGLFHRLGGSWQRFHMGSVDEVSRLKDLLESYFEVRDHPEEYGLDEKSE